MSKREHYGSPRRFISIGFPLLSHYARTLMGKRKGEEIKGKESGCVVCVCGRGGKGGKNQLCSILDIFPT